MNVTEQVRKHMIETRTTPSAITVGDHVKCDNCGEILLIDAVGEQYWVGLVGNNTFILKCCNKKDILEQGGIFFLSEEEEL